jgi:hypothetical protein
MKKKTMNNIISDVPEDWLVSCVAAQGRALMALIEHEKLSDGEALTHKSILYYGWILNRSGVFSIDEQVQIIEKHISHPLFKERVTSALSIAYQALDECYTKEKDEKGLVSDIFGKTTFQ